MVSLQQTLLKPSPSQQEKIPQSYKEFMAVQLEESQKEAKRHFENYINVRT